MAKIGINTRFLLPNKMEGFGRYTFEIVKQMVLDHPEHEFLFFFDRPYDPKFIFASNVTPIVVGIPARHPILFYLWFEISIYKALKKHKVDVFFSPDGYLCLKSKVPQIAVIHDINFEHYPKDLPFFARIYLRHFFPKFARKAKKIITVSEFSKQDISKKYKIELEKIAVVWNGVSDSYKVISEDEKLNFRKLHNLNSPYFYFVGSLHPRKNVNRLIEAFLQFKTSHQSDLKLIIVGSQMWKGNKFTAKVPQELKNEILWKGHLNKDELGPLVCAAEALIFVPYFEGFGLPLVEAMRCGTPIISGNLTSLPEIAGDAALYCDPFNVQDIANKMATLHSNPELKKELGQKGLKRSELFSWNEASKKVWTEIDLFLNKEKENNS